MKIQSETCTRKVYKNVRRFPLYLSLGYYREKKGPDTSLIIFFPFYLYTFTLRTTNFKYNDQTN